jgi:hypothetical protein
MKVRPIASAFCRKPNAEPSHRLVPRRVTALMT